MNLFIIFGAVLASNCVLQILFVQATGNNLFIELHDQSYRDMIEEFGEDPDVMNIPNVIPNSVKKNMNQIMEEMKEGPSSIVADYKDDLFQQIFCAYRGVKLCKKDDKKCLLAFLYIHYLVLYHHHRICVVFRNRTDIEEYDPLRKEINYYKRSQMRLEILYEYLLVIGNYVPKDLIFKKLQKICRSKEEKNKLQTVKENFEIFYNFNNDIQHFLCATNDKPVPVFDQESFLPPMEVLNNYFGEMLPESQLPSLPSSDLATEFELVKSIISTYEYPPKGNKLSQVIKSMIPYTFKPVKVKTPDAGVSGGTSTEDK